MRPRSGRQSQRRHVALHFADDFEPPLGFGDEHGGDGVDAGDGGEVGEAGLEFDGVLVREDGSNDEMVLKVALDASLNDRLAGEGEALSKLGHPNIVRWQRTLTVNGRTALLIHKAGEKTLADRIREEARLSLDLLQRFGEELIQAVDYLDQQGVAHRDINPD